MRTAGVVMAGGLCAVQPDILRLVSVTVLEPSVALRSSACAVYPDGRVCISILHNPGDDPNGYETAAERWSPVQSVREGRGWMGTHRGAVHCVEGSKRD